MAEETRLASAVIVHALRAVLGLTQKQLAELAGVERVEILAVEKGRNKASSARMRDGLASAFRLTGSEMSAALTGPSSVAAVASIVAVVRARAQKHASPRRQRAA